MYTEQRELILPSRLESIDEAAQAATVAATEAGVAEDALFAIDLAVREAVANAVKHGNNLDETKNVTVLFAKSTTFFEITVRDEGDGFDFENLPDPTDPANLLKESGRGAFLMRNFMDEVVWQNNGATVRMNKSF